MYTPRCARSEGYKCHCPGRCQGEPGVVSVTMNERKVTDSIREKNKVSNPYRTCCAMHCIRHTVTWWLFLTVRYVFRLPKHSPYKCSLRRGVFILYNVYEFMLRWSTCPSLQGFDLLGAGHEQVPAQYWIMYSDDSPGNPACKETGTGSAVYQGAMKTYDRVSCRQVGQTSG